VELVGLLAGHHGQADDRVLVHLDQATGLSHPTTLLQMLQDGNGLVVGQLAAVQGRPFAFREALLAASTSQHAGVFFGSVAEADAEIIQAPAAVIGALGVLAAEVFQVVHGSLVRLP